MGANCKRQARNGTVGRDGKKAVMATAASRASSVLVETKSRVVTMALGGVLQGIGYHPVSTSQVHETGVSPALLLVDLTSLESVLPIVRKVNPSVKAIVIDLGTDGPLNVRASHEVQAVLPVQATREVLQRTIDAVVRGRYAARLPPDPTPTCEKGLEVTPRERDILLLTRRGLSNTEMAALLRLSRYTLRSRLYQMYAKFGIRNRAAFTFFATQLLGARIVTPALEGREHTVSPQNTAGLPLDC